MLETSEERIKLLKKGIEQKQIEELYIEENNFKIADPPVFIELVEISEKQNNNIYINPMVTVEYAQTLCSEMASIFNMSQLVELLSKSCLQENTSNH